MSRLQDRYTYSIVSSPRNAACNGHNHRRNRMEKAAALKILQQLADGTDPHTGKAFGADSPYQHPDTVRALFVALRALDAPAAATAPAGKQRTAAPAENAPSHSGKPWS